MTRIWIVKKVELHNWVRNGHLGFLACLPESSRTNLIKQCEESDRWEAHQSQQVWHDLKDQIYHNELKAQCEREKDQDLIYMPASLEQG